MVERGEAATLDGWRGRNLMIENQLREAEVALMTEGDQVAWIGTLMGSVAENVKACAESLEDLASQEPDICARDIGNGLAALVWIHLAAVVVMALILVRVW